MVFFEKSINTKIESKLELKDKNNIELQLFGKGWSAMKEDSTSKVLSNITVPTSDSCRAQLLCMVLLQKVLRNAIADQLK